MQRLRDLVDELLQAKVKAKLFGGDHAPQLGRLRLLDRLGAGAMGTVFAAYDPRLDRKVAVKVLRTVEAASRVLIEARALAKLAHPNVVAVYDAEEVDGLVYIVMELVPGVPLRAWVGAKHSWQQVVRVLREAATGIAAAHRAGLVHRDIKPDNILVGDDRARVVDFGLANAHDARDGTSAGTPFYMAPEVLAGQAATPESDQFSFGVTMFEALYGRRPHGVDVETTAATVPASALSRNRDDLREELATSATKAAIAVRPPLTNVPTWVHAIVTRALAANPGERYASMDEVVTALSGDRQRLIKLATVGGSAVLVAAIAGGIIANAGSDPKPDLCGGAAARTEPVWRRGGLGMKLQAFEWSKSSLVAMDRHIDAWHTSYRKVCEATRVRGDQSDSLLDLRMRCLDRSLARFAALSGWMSMLELDAETVAAVPGALAELPDPVHCETVTSLADLALPTDPTERAKATQVEQSIDRAWAAYVLGRYAEAGAALVTATDALASQKVPRLRAETLALGVAIESRTLFVPDADQKLDEALLAAAEAQTPELEYEIWTRKLRNALFGADPARVLDWAIIARAAAKRIGRDGAEVDGIVGEALRNAGKLDAARQHLERALASNELREDQRAIVEMNLGSTLLAGGDAVGALTIVGRARDRVLTALGDKHPDLALYMDKMAAAQRASGQLRAALALHDKSLALRVAAFGPSDRAVATSLLYRAQTRIEAGDLRGARDDATKARGIREEVYKHAQRRVGEVVAALGDVIAAGGAHEEALAYYDQAARLDGKLDLTARRFASGGKVDLDAISEPADDETLTTDRIGALAVRVQLLVKAKRLADAKNLTAKLVTRDSAALDPGYRFAIASALLAVGDRDSAKAILDPLLKALGNEPTRTALRIAIALAQASSEPQAARVAISLYQALPSLERGPVYDAIWALSKR